MARDRLHVRQQNKIYHFIEIEFSEDRDGSFYIFFVRQGASDKHILCNYDTCTKESRIKDETHEVQRRGLKVSYHTTGLVHYEDTYLPRIYCEPIYSITVPLVFLTISVPSITQLDVYEDDVNEEDSILEIPTDIQDRVNFRFIISPPEYLDLEKNTACRIAYLKLFDLSIIAEPNIYPIPNGCHNCFSYFSPQNGLYDHQVVDKHTALIMFHQKNNGTRGHIVFPPNGEGVWKIIHTVPMRIPPQINIYFAEPQYHAEKVENGSSVSYTRFVVKDKHGRKVMKQLSIVSIELDAEL